MKIVYIGNFGPQYSTENDVKSAIEDLGHECITIQETEVHNHIHSILQRDFDLLLVTGTQGFNKIPLNRWLTLMHDLAVRGIPTATLHLDTFWSTTRGGREWWNEQMFHTAFIFTADGDYQKEWTLLGKNHIWLPPGIRHTAVKKGTSKPQYECDVAFVGSNGNGYHEDVWPYRKELVGKLREMCQRNGWSFKNPGGDDPKIDRDDSMNDFYASAKVTVGDSLCLKKENSHYWSDRVPEAWGRGGFLLMPRIDALIAMYNQPTYEWGDWNNLEEEIKFWLKNETAREVIVNENQSETAKKHTYKNRIETILEIIYEAK